MKWWALLMMGLLLGTGCASSGSKSAKRAEKLFDGLVANLNEELKEGVNDWRGLVFVRDEEEEQPITDAIDIKDISALAYTTKPDAPQWPITQPGTQSEIVGGRMVLHGYDPTMWKPAFGAKQVNATAWIGRRLADGSIYFKTWEYVPNITNERGIDFGPELIPRHGETLYVFYSTLARDGVQHNGEERTNISAVMWR